MAILRKIALGLLLAALTAALVTAGWELWNHQQWASLPLSAPGITPGDRSRVLEDRMDLLTKRVGDMELLVLILLGTSGFYSIVLVLSSYFSTTSFARQADQTIQHIQDQIGLAMGDLRELQEETEQKLQQMTAARTPEVPEPLAAWETQVAEMSARVAAWRDTPLSEHARLELVRDENTAAYLEVVAGSRAGSALAGLYLGFGRIYASSDAARSRFYLERALRLAAPESPLASEIHYDLACGSAASHEFSRAMRELTAAFEHQFKTLDERLAGDIEEGGRLYELASTAPFDKAVNDLLLNMSIGIG
jgi:hypothetical protein